MKVLFIHAHYDDYEFAAAGTLEMWRRKCGAELQNRVVICTDGAAGHQFRTREETARMRCQEQLDSARIGGFEFAPLRLPNGAIPRESSLQISVPLLAAFWKAIRDFEPHYLLCPPVAADPLAGVHIDHIGVAEAVRQVAYMINVPHCFTPEFPADETQPQPCQVPVILNVYDDYFSSAGNFDFAVDIEPAMDLIAGMSWCHQSQIMEWLPWVGRHKLEPPKDFAEWKNMLGQRFERRNLELGLPARPLCEVFSVTAWGEIPTVDRILADFPNLVPGLSHLDRLKARLDRWLAK